MKTINLTKAKDSLSELVKESQGEVIVVTVHGKPAALIRGVDGFDMDELLMYADPKFWRWAAKRQRRADDRSKTVSAAEARRRLMVKRRTEDAEDAEFVPIERGEKDATLLLASYNRNKEHLFDALQKAGHQISWLQGWEAKLERLAAKEADADETPHGRPREVGDETMPKTATDKTKQPLLAVLDAHEFCVQLFVDEGRHHAGCEPGSMVGLGDDPVMALEALASLVLDEQHGIHRDVRATAAERALLSQLDVNGQPLSFYVAADEDTQRWDVGRESDYGYGSGDTLTEAIRAYLDGRPS